MRWRDVQRARRNRAESLLRHVELRCGCGAYQEQGARFGLDHRALEVLAGERADGIDRVPQRGGDELHILAVALLQPVRAAMPIIALLLPFARPSQA